MEIVIDKKKPLWVPLHVHTEYSALDGAIRVPKYYDFAKNNGLPAAGVSDHFTMSSWAEMDKVFHDVKPIFGCELYSESMLPTGPAVPFKGRRRYHFNSFALTKKGLINLQKLAADGYKADDEAAAGPYAVNFNGLQQYHEDVIFSSACLSGELPILLANGKYDQAEHWLDIMRSTVGKDNFYIELLDISYPEQDAMNDKLIDFAKKHEVKMIVTTDSHYMPEDVSWYNALLAAQKKQVISDDASGSNAQAGENGETLDERFNAWDVTGRMDLSMRTPEQIWEKWKDKCPEAVVETIRLAERVERFTLKGDKYKLPHMGSSAEGFRDKAYRGLDDRLINLDIPTDPDSSEYQDYRNRLEKELKVVESMGFIEYFTLVEDLVKSCKAKGIKVGPGRGSAAGSMLAWSLGITELNPKMFGLLFERFLNPERVSMPDIDIDFEDERRGEAIEYLKSKYGDAAVVPIANYSRCKWKNGIRDAARVLGAQPWQGDALVKSLEGFIDTSFTSDDETADDYVPETDVTAESLLHFIKVRGKHIADLGDDKVAKIIELAGHFNGMLRNYGKHASGIVISPGRADDYLPLGRIKGSISSQFNMDDVDYVKLVKVDILGLSTLSMIKEIEEETQKYATAGHPSPVMKDFVRFINSYGNKQPGDCNDLKLEAETGISCDSIKKTFELFDSGNTTGVFQFASSGMRNLLRKIRPHTIEDLSAAVALFRPGPLGSGITDDYIATGNPNKYKKRNGETEREHKTFPDTMKADIAEIASDTRGMIIYQEHIMKTAQKIAGYTLGEADILRKAIGKKKKELMVVERKKFVQRCVEKGYKAEDAETAFDTIEYFAGYGFNKSHSFCYAALAFITAWYAANRAPAFWTSIINDTVKKQRNDSRGQNKIAQLLRECSKNIKVLAPMIIENFENSTVEQVKKTRFMFNKSDDKTTIGMDDNISDLEKISDDTWSSPRSWAIMLGLSITKGLGKSDKNIQKLIDLGVTSKDTVQDMIRKAVKMGDKTYMMSAATFFLNGFFDKVLENTLKLSRNTLAPVYMRLAILDMANPSCINTDLLNALSEACTTLNNKGTIDNNSLKKKPNGLYFDITKSRSVWGSFLDFAVRKIISPKLKWDEEKINIWLSNDGGFGKLFIAMTKRAAEIQRKMSVDPQERMRRMLQIYRVEKGDLGESVTVPDWAMAAEMTGWTFSMFADEASEYARESYHFVRDDNDAIQRMSAAGGFWVLGQFVSAVWKGTVGYIVMEGRFGQKTKPIYINTRTKLPFINIDAMKRVQAYGGYIAAKVIYDREMGGYMLVDDGNCADNDVNGGFLKLTKSIAILPLMSALREGGTEKDQEVVVLKQNLGIVGRAANVTGQLDNKNWDEDIVRLFKDKVWIEKSDHIKVIRKRLDPQRGFFRWEFWDC